MNTLCSIWPVVLASLTLLLGIQTYRLRRANALLSLPYIEPRKPYNSCAPVLGGDHADKWQIERVRIRKPRGASFLDQRVSYDPGGSIVTSDPVKIGKVVLDPAGKALYVQSESWPVELSFKIVLRSSPKTKRSLMVLWSA